MAPGPGRGSLVLARALWTRAQDPGLSQAKLPNGPANHMQRHKEASAAPVPVCARRPQGVKARATASRGSPTDRLGSGTRALELRAPPQTLRASSWCCSKSPVSRWPTQTLTRVALSGEAEAKLWTTLAVWMKNVVGGEGGGVKSAHTARIFMFLGALV